MGGWGGGQGGEGAAGTQKETPNSPKSNGCWMQGSHQPYTVFESQASVTWHSAG